MFFETSLYYNKCCCYGNLKSVFVLLRHPIHDLNFSFSFFLHRTKMSSFVLEHRGQSLLVILCQKAVFGYVQDSQL